MENSANQQHESNEPSRPAEEAADSQAKAEPQSSKGGFDPIFSAMREAANDAKDAAEKAIPKVKAAASDAAYWLAYGVSFAAVFQWNVAKHLAPQRMKTGYRDGVKAGRKSAEAWMEKQKQRSDHESAPSLVPSGPCADQTQPSPA